MSSFLPPTKPREVVCFKPILFNTQNEGKAYVFLAFDVYSKFMINTGIVTGLKPAEIMKQVFALMINQDFRKHDTPFTLIMDMAEDLEEELNLIVEPFDGKVIFDQDYIEEKMSPEIDLMLSFMQRA